jgi:hypothetical protein
MIDLKNRSREVRTYQYPRNVSAGPVRPKVLDVARGKHNPKTGEVVVAPKQITVGGVLTLPPRSEAKGLPDALLSHPSLQRDIAARVVIVKQYPNPTRKASIASVEVKPDAAPATKKATKKSRRKG